LLDVRSILAKEESMPHGRPRPTIDRDSPVSLILELHHRCLDEMLDHVEMSVEIGNWDEARIGFAAFQTELEEHMRLEEGLMFPSFEAFTRSPGGPTAVMRAEHDEIRTLLTVLEGFLCDEQPIDDATTALETLLASHNAKEEQVVYPMFERHAPAEAYAALDHELRPLVSSQERQRLATRSVI
jgi:iron-sulfur cluster repair protein YtfE (RIC family)